MRILKSVIASFSSTVSTNNGIKCMLKPTLGTLYSSEKCLIYSCSTKKKTKKKKKSEYKSSRWRVSRARVEMNETRQGIATRVSRRVHQNRVNTPTASFSDLIPTKMFHVRSTSTARERKRERERERERTRNLNERVYNFAVVVFVSTVMFVVWYQKGKEPKDSSSLILVSRITLIQTLRRMITKVTKLVCAFDAHDRNLLLTFTPHNIFSLSLSHTHSFHRSGKLIHERFRISSTYTSYSTSSRVSSKCQVTNGPATEWA